jgi:C-methyltransferase
MAAAVAAAARLGIADVLADGPKSAPELAAATQISEPVLGRVLRLLASLDVFRQDPDGRFENTPDSERLRTDHPGSVRNFCLLAAGEYDRSFDELTHTLDTGEPAFRKVFGGSVYDYMTRTPAAAEVYDLAMDEIARPVAAALASLRDFSGVRTIVDVDVDVGGGRGILARELLAAHPHLTGTVVDRPDVCARAAAELREAEPALAARLAFVGGDFFDGVPAGADLYMLKNVLHNWSDDSAARILASVEAAMDGGPGDGASGDGGRAGGAPGDGRPGARLLVIEPLHGAGPPSVHEAMDDLMQVVICEPGTTARTEADLRSLFDRAALAVAGADRLATGHSVVEVVRQDARRREPARRC